LRKTSDTDITAFLRGVTYELAAWFDDTKLSSEEFDKDDEVAEVLRITQELVENVYKRPGSAARLVKDFGRDFKNWIRNEAELDPLTLHPRSTSSEIYDVIDKLSDESVSHPVSTEGIWQHLYLHVNSFYKNSKNASRATSPAKTVRFEDDITTENSGELTDELRKRILDLEGQLAEAQGIAAAFENQARNAQGAAEANREALGNALNKQVAQAEQLAAVQEQLTKERKRATEFEDKYRDATTDEAYFTQVQLYLQDPNLFPSINKDEPQRTTEVPAPSNQERDSRKRNLSPEPTTAEASLAAHLIRNVSPRR
jgi:hypothetical protein